ncbi:MAG: cation-translocating P-type ATPase, partial [Pseudomonadota bacterium]|nr:cation-translocating P-type ATPase [Pseudomonadota bacterium]
AGFATAQAGGLAAAELRPAVFLALVAALYLMVLANRDPARGLHAALRQGNPWLGHVSLAVAGVLALLVLLPPLRAIMGFGVLSWQTAEVAVALSVACAAWLGVHRMQRDLGH